MTHKDLKHISEWEYVELVDGLLMKQYDERDQSEQLIGYIADFFSQSIVIDIAGKVKKNSIPQFEDIRSGLFKSTKEREEEALEEWRKLQRSEADKQKEQEDKQKQAETEKAKLLERFGMK